MRHKIKIIGLTGGIGSGKSTILQLFKELGCQVFIADLEARILMNSNSDLISEIRELFGDKAYVDGLLNRPWIADIVFKHPDKLTQLNALVHPRVRTRFQQVLSTCKAEILIYEAAILFESGGAGLCDYIITVYSDRDTRIQRIMERDGLAYDEVMIRIASQMDETEKISKADFVLENDLLEQTKLKVKVIYDLLIKLK